MARNLSKKVDSMEYDGLISGLTPQVKVGGGVIAKLATETAYTRGTVLAKNGDGKLVILGTAVDNLTPNCILADDVVVGTDADVNAAVYEMGCFDPEKLTVAKGHTITEAEKDELRQRGIYLTAMSK